ncbi:32040_t:CDS:1, partial [Racocetra persica]
ANDYMALTSICGLTIDAVSDIIEQKLIEEEELFIVENFNTGPKNLKDIIPFNKRIMEIFISRFSMNHERILVKLDSCPFTSDN